MLHSWQINKHIKKYKTLKEKNAIILTALDDGYRQIDIANYLNVSRSLVSKVIREEVQG